MKKHSSPTTIFSYIALIIFALLPLSLIISKRLGEEYIYSIKDISFSVELSNGTSHNINCWYDEESKKYYSFLPSYAKGENTTISVPAGVDLNIDGINIYNGAPLSTVSTERDLKVSVYNKRGEIIENSSLEIVGTKNVASTFIYTDSGDIEKVNADKSHKEPGNVTVISADGNIDYSGELEYIKGRGNATFGYPKKPYVIQLARDADLLNLGIGKKWVLFANYLDKSNIRNKIAYETAEKAGLKFTPDCDFSDLYIDGEYKGLYLLSEPVEVGANRVEIQDLALSTQTVNSVELKDYLPFIYNEGSSGEIKGHDIPSNPLDITGGYLLEIELDWRYNAEASGFITETGQAVVVQSPKYASPEQMDYISGYLNEFTDALYTEDGINPNTGKGYWEYIDVTSWAKKYLLDEIFKCLDSGLTSSYLYKFSDKVDSKIYAGPVWDYDWSGGNCVSNNLSRVVNISHPDGFWALREFSSDNLNKQKWNLALCAHKDFYQEIIKEYKETFLPIINNLINNDIAELSDLIYDSDKMDKIRWKINEDPTLVTFETNEEYYEHIKDFLKRRIDFLSDVWLNNEKYYTLTIEIPVGEFNIYLVGKVDEKFQGISNYQQGEKYIGGGVEYIFDGFYYKDTKTIFDPNEPAKTDVSVYANFIKIEPELTPLSFIKSHRTIIYVLIVAVIAGFFFIKTILDNKSKTPKGEDYS